MDDDGDDRTETSTAGDGGFTEEYALATEADVINNEADDEDVEGAVAGSLAPDIEVTPGTPDIENVVFVALGVYIALIAVGRMFAGAAMYAPVTLVTVTLVVAAGTAALYMLFIRTNPDT